MDLVNTPFEFDITPSNTIVGCSSTRLTDDELGLFSSLHPLGLILFARNIASPEQVVALTDQFRQVTQNPAALVLVDQEGGRVSRLTEPHWRRPPSPTVFAKAWKVDPDLAINACELNYRLIGIDLAKSGINVNCAPMVDIPSVGASTIVTERALGNDFDSVIALAQATVDGLAMSDIAPVLKHAPGHGRGKVDSHLELPVVDASKGQLQHSDFVPFAHFNTLPMMMTAHITYTALDKKHPATLSRRVIQDIIRKTIGFDGLLMTDDIDMHALSGSVADKACRAWQAGCDIVLQCSGNIEDLQQLATVAQPLSGQALQRALLAAADALPRTQTLSDTALASLREEWDTLAKELECISL